MRILDMIEGLEIDPRQIVEAIEGRTVVTAQTSPVTPSPTVTIFPLLRLGHIATEDGSDLISMWAKETGIRPRGIYQARLDMAKFVTLIEHDDATRVAPQQIVLFKEHLAKRGLGAPTINRYLSAVKSPPCAGFAAQSPNSLSCGDIPGNAVKRPHSIFSM